MSHFYTHTPKMDIVGIRDLKTGEVELLKNRCGPLKDYEIEQFILNYGRKRLMEEKLNRFYILDL